MSHFGRNAKHASQATPNSLLLSPISPYRSAPEALTARSAHPTRSATIGGTDKSAWKSSYQAFADGSDDIGKVRRLSRKKSHQGAQQQRSELSLFQSGRTFLTGRDEIENDRGDNRMPGYTGHVPKVSERQCGPKTARAKGAKRERSLTPKKPTPSIVLLCGARRTGRARKATIGTRRTSPSSRRTTGTTWWGTRDTSSEQNKKRWAGRGERERGGKVFHGHTGRVETVPSLSVIPHPCFPFVGAVFTHHHLNSGCFRSSPPTRKRHDDASRTSRYRT